MLNHSKCPYICKIEEAICFLAISSFTCPLLHTAIDWLKVNLGVVGINHFLSFSKAVWTCESLTDLSYSVSNLQIDYFCLTLI